MARFKLTIEFDGSHFKGWQKNKHEITVQGTIIESCEKIFGNIPIEVYGAGRTDAGVHAQAQIAHLDVETTLSATQIQEALNESLPASIHILDMQNIHERFHARHHATARSYVYVISNRRSAFFKRYIWWIKQPLDIQAMQQAAKCFVGFHDFASFGRVFRKDESTTVNIEHMQIHTEKNTIYIHIIGSHFLWSQVRRMVGVLVEVGKHKLNIQDVKHMIQTNSERPAQLTAPASGLYLEKVYYEHEPLNLQPQFPIIIV